MKVLKKIFAAFMIFGFVMSGSENVGAADLKFDSNINLQEVAARYILPQLPDRIRHRKDSHKLQKPSPKKIELPPRKQQSPAKYTQRQPKQPPKLTTPSRPVPTSDRRGSQPRKNFGPPRFR